MSQLIRPISTVRSLWSAVRGAVSGSLDELFPAVVEQELKTAREEGWQIDHAASYCHRCGASTGAGEATSQGCSHCVTTKLAWDHLIRLSLYKPPIASWIIAMKFHRQWAWAPWLGKALAAQVTQPEQHLKSIICPVPSPRLRRWCRGYSQTHLMAQSFAKATGWRMAQLLHRKGWQRPQTRVLVSQRALNVRDAFRLDGVDLTGYEVWLIDDVKTSGATLTACAKLLRLAGAAKINIAVAAVADPKHADFKLK